LIEHCALNYHSGCRLSIALSFSAESSAGSSITLSLLDSLHTHGRALCSHLWFIVNEVHLYFGWSPLWTWIEPHVLWSLVGSLPIDHPHRLIVVIVIDTISVSIKTTSIALVRIVEAIKQQTTPSAYLALG
jgi:hypothetical protein